MIRKDWIEQTDKLITKAHELGLQTMNGDLLIAKQPPQKKSDGGIILSGIQSNMDSYFKGFGRIIQLPSSDFATTRGAVKTPPEFRTGDFVLFTHSARYKPNPVLVDMIFEEQIEDEAATTDINDEYHDRGMLFFVSCFDVRLIKPQERVIQQAQ